MGWTPPPTASVCQDSGVVDRYREEASMGDVSIIGLDLAKNSFQAHGAKADGTVAFKKKLSRKRGKSPGRLWSGPDNGLNLGLFRDSVGSWSSRYQILMSCRPWC